MREKLTGRRAGLLIADAAVIVVLVAGAGLAARPGLRRVPATWWHSPSVRWPARLAALVPALLRWPGWTTVPTAVVLYLLFGAAAAVPVVGRRRGAAAAWSRCDCSVSASSRPGSRC